MRLSAEFSKLSVSLIELLNHSFLRCAILKFRTYSICCMITIGICALVSPVTASSRINLKFSPVDNSTVGDTNHRTAIKKVLSSELPDPSQASLNEVLAKTNRIRVFDGGASKGKLLSKKVLLDSTDSEVIGALSKALEIDEESPCQEMSIGGPSIELMHDKKRLALIVYQHGGNAIRWETNWHLDATLHYSRQLVDWFADAGIEGPKVAVEKELQEKRRTAADLQKWLMSMPSCLRPNIGMIVVPGMTDLLIYSPLPVKKLPSTVVPITANERLKQIMSDLDGEFSDPHVKILALLQWYASGVGVWTGFPCYEELPAELLLTLPTQTIVEALHMKAVSEPEIEGAARYFASHLFRVSKPQDLKLLDQQLRTRLLEHCMKSEDQDKRYRAECAFNLAN